MDISERKLVLISGGVVIIGLCVLGYAIYLLEENPLTYNEFLAQEEVRVVLEGEIINSRTSGDITFIEFKTTCVLPGVLFEKQTIDTGPAIITGTKKYYKGKSEVIIDQVKQ